MTTRISSGPVHVHAYAGRLTVKAGETLPIMISAEGTNSVAAQLVRLVHGDAHPNGPGFVEEEIDNPVNGPVPVREQPVQRGNFLTVDDHQGRLKPGGSFSLWAFIQPTLPGCGRQAIVSWDGGADLPASELPHLAIGADGRLTFSGGAQAPELRCRKPLLPHLWYLVVASFDGQKAELTLSQRAIIGRSNGRWSKLVPIDYDDAVSAACPAVSWGGASGVIVGGRRTGGPAQVAECYNGKIDRFGLFEGSFTQARSDEMLELVPALATLVPEGTIALWDGTVGLGAGGVGDVVRDRGPFGLDATGVNRPVRGQTGWNWDGRSESFAQTPDQYGGIEFHDDALADCGWEPSVAIDLPPDLRSGVYALRLSAEGMRTELTERAVFFVRPREPRARLALLMPTATYLAYANGPRSMEGDVGQAVMGRAPVLSWRDIEAAENGYAFGLSVYDTHRNGGGVCYSTARRPIFTMQPDYRNPGVAAPWGLAADLSIVAWLDHCGYEYDVITDETLHAEGLDALSPYQVVINGTHCEYYSTRMLDATEDYLAGGGRLLYLSGNGYYWVVGFRPDEPWVMEIRRREGGSRAWEGRSGEGHLVSTGEPGGLWRHRNRAPQKLVGTGFAAEGMDISFPYRRLAKGDDAQAGWIFEGVDGETVGGFGLIHGGAVGLEVDRYDPALGSPPHAVRLATSELLSANWPLVPEDLMFNHPGVGGDLNARARCDMVYFTTANGGAVFSSSSIAWAGALPVNGFDNDVSRIMRNVVDGFLGDLEH